jgi:hypothetical protein
MALDAAAAAIGRFVLGERGEEACGGPALLVGLLGELGPHQLDARQVQLGQQQFDASGINLVVARHTTTSM